jgi:hypothetical protein
MPALASAVSNWPNGSNHNTMRGKTVTLNCGNCGGRAFRLRRAEGGADAECANCGAIIQNSMVRAATTAAPPTLTLRRVNSDADTG